MNGKENIIANILSNAQAESAQAIALAQQKVEEIQRTDQAFCAELKAKTVRQSDESEKTAISRAVTLANMDVKKLTLQAKQSVLSTVFSQAEERILNLSDKDYLKFILSLLNRYAENGETVVISSKDRNRVSEGDILSYAKQKNITLSYRADGAFSGGVILESEKCDKNLTVFMLLKEYKEEHETEIAKILAGE